MKAVRLAALTAAWMGWTLTAWAWGPQGHQSIGALAEALLAGTHAGAQVRLILGSEPLMTAALWADCAKGVTERAPYHYVVNARYADCAPFETPAGQRAMVAYVKRNLAACHPAPGQEVCHKQYHYADVAIQRDGYARSEVGTSDHDIVRAVGACVAVLKGQASPAPFDIRSKKEALRLLAHFIGDLHQPLHVGAVYLDPAGHAVDPDGAGLDPDSATQGGNLLKDGARKLHAEWDGIPASLQAAAFTAQGVRRARSVPATQGPLKDWPAAWASGTVRASHAAFAPLTYAPEVNAGTAQRSWAVTEPAGYAAARTALQKGQLVEAGAHLAELLQAVWP